LVFKTKKKEKLNKISVHKLITKKVHKKKKSYHLKQLVTSRKNILNFSSPLVKKGEGVQKGQVIANGNYVQNEELALGYNLRVAYCC